MSRLYEIITADDGFRYIETIFEKEQSQDLVQIPYTGQEESEIQEQINNILISSIIDPMVPKTCVDVVYVNKEVVRRDYSIRTDEGSLVIDKLETEFPNFVPDYRRAKNNAVAEYGAYREPYANSSLSFYDFQIYMPEAIQEKFNVSYTQEEMKTWYGLKFDLVTREVLLKAVLLDFEGDKPLLPKGHPIYKNYYAITHAQDGTSSDWVDAYVFSTKHQMKEFCASQGLDYPLPDEIDPGCVAIWNWGFVFNTKTLEYGPVKAYARYYLPDNSPHTFTTRD